MTLIYTIKRPFTFAKALLQNTFNKQMTDENKLIIEKVNEIDSTVSAMPNLDNLVFDNDLNLVLDDDLNPVYSE